MGGITAGDMRLAMVPRDAFVALKLALSPPSSPSAVSANGSRRRLTLLVRTWLLVPLGLVATLAVCFAVDALLRLGSVSFPASVACMVLLFLGLCAAERLLGGQRTKALVGVIDVSAGWALRWINVFLTPGFVTMPLSPSIGFTQVLKIIGVFVVGFLIMMVLSAHLTRAIQKLVGSSKRATFQRGEELGGDIDVAAQVGIPLVEDHPVATTAADDEYASRATSISGGVAPPSSSAPLMSDVDDVDSAAPRTPPQLRLQDHVFTVNPSLDGLTTESLSRREDRYPAQNTPVPTRPERWATILTANVDCVTYAALFLLVSLPVYYTRGYAMPAQLTIVVLCYFAALSIPPRWSRFFHPVLACSLFSVLAIWALAASTGSSLTAALREFRTGVKYLQLWQNSRAYDGVYPGAGDVFATLLDASIVALALPMFQHRRELRAHAVSIVVPCVAVSLGSLLAYPPLCAALGISAPRSLAFASRSLTLALALPATQNLGGDINTVAAIAIISGILGVLVGPWMLTRIKIPEDDYVTRGVTLGINSSAIATAVLLKTDPRAAALSSLSMSLFGTITVLFTSIPPAASLVHSLVGL